jgi:membrane associated rhomboid family serine protease
VIADRPYMRKPTPWRLPHVSATAVLIAVNLVVFVFQNINAVYLHWPVERELALSRDGLENGKLWQLFTFQFLHLGSWHFICNALGLFFLGRLLESALGQGRMLEVYFGSSFLGGVLQATLALILPSYFGMPTMGASAGVCGLLAAFAMLERDRTLLFMFVLPIRAWYLLLFTLAVTVFFVLVPSEPGVAHAAHLGGLLGGMGYVHWILRRERRLFDWSHAAPERAWREELVRASYGETRPRRRPDPGPEDLPPAEFISREVDPILDKISAHGLQSLTERERRILEQARARMLKR